MVKLGLNQIIQRLILMMQSKYVFLTRILTEPELHWLNGLVQTYFTVMGIQIKTWKDNMQNVITNLTIGNNCSLFWYKVELYNKGSPLITLMRGGPFLLTANLYRYLLMHEQAHSSPEQLPSNKVLVKKKQCFLPFSFHF